MGLRSRDRAVERATWWNKHGSLHTMVRHIHRRQVWTTGISSAGWKFYLLFCVFNVLAIFFVYFCVKETKGLSLEEIDVLFAKKEYRHEMEARFRRSSNAADKGSIVTEKEHMATDNDDAAVSD